ncbi:MAG: nucleotidyl transferase AbiEii/AbiGii toxin family protein [Candidatus Thermoplasmatota archaeon]|nr:nucleotidyl transferase AbiEii/AbiGii toxin family protein [Candidatus Thermoplasmatota archaeon]
MKEMILRITRSNPFNMVLKGGTALAYHHLDWHRTSEDLDFDAPLEIKDKIEEIEKWFIELLDEMVKEGKIRDFIITKSAFVNTDRHHMKLKITTHNDLYSKIDIDFKKIRSELEYDGELGFYSSEHMLISKLLTYRSRGTLKDIYDIHYLLKEIDPECYDNRSELVELVEEVITKLQEEDLEKIFGKAFANVDLRFRNLRSKELPVFKDRTLRELNIFKNKLQK